MEEMCPHFFPISISPIEMFSMADTDGSNRISHGEFVDV